MNCTATGHETSKVIGLASRTFSQALGIWLVLCILYHLPAVSPTSTRPLCIMDSLLLNPTDDAFHAVRDQMQCSIH